MHTTAVACALCEASRVPQSKRGLGLAHTQSADCGPLCCCIGKNGSFHLIQPHGESLTFSHPYVTRKAFWHVAIH